MKWGRTAVAAGFVAALAGGLWWAFSPQPMAVDIALVEAGELRISIDEEGLARVRDVYQVFAPVSGELLRLPVRVGDAVKPGAVVATIVPQESGLLDPRSRAEAEAAARAAEDSVLAAQSELNLATSERAYWQTELARKERLLERGITTLQAVQQARLEVSRRESLIASGQAALEMRTHQLEQAQARLVDPVAAADGEVREILAPVAGAVLGIDNESARSVVAGAPLLQIGQPDDLEIVVDLLSADAVRIAPGAPATITGWGGPGQLAARVRRIEPTGFTRVSALGVEEQRVPVQLDLLDPPAARPRLGHLYRVFVSIEAQRVELAVLTPPAALCRADNRWSTFGGEAGKAVLRPLAIGARTADLAEVVDGVAAGAHVVVHPSDRLVDGTPVVPR